MSTILHIPFSIYKTTNLSYCLRLRISYVLAMVENRWFIWFDYLCPNQKGWKMPGKLPHTYVEGTHGGSFRFCSRQLYCLLWNPYKFSSESELHFVQANLHQGPSPEDTTACLVQIVRCTAAAEAAEFTSPPIFPLNGKVKPQLRVLPAS